MSASANARGGRSRRENSELGILVVILGSKVGRANVTGLRLERMGICLVRIKYPRVVLILLVLEEEVDEDEEEVVDIEAAILV